MALNSTGRKQPDAADIPTFAAFPAFQQLTGPLRIYRFGSETGKWWYEESLIEEMKSDFYEGTLGGGRMRNPADSILGNPRTGLAVSQEWNKFVWLCTMKLRPQDAVECWAGPTAPQPEWQNKPDGRILHGGLTQYLIYDVAMIPSQQITRTPVAALWREFSRTVSRF